MFLINNVLKKGDVLSSLLCNCFRVRNYESSGKPGWLEIEWYTSAFVYADDVSVLAGSMHALKKSTEVLVVASKEIGLEANADKTKYMVMSKYLTTRQSHNVNIDNNSFERVEYFL
jgi:hypothetical protein